MTLGLAGGRDEHNAGVGRRTRARNWVASGVGAKKSHIRWQFLLEALVMTLVAGAIGMLLSEAITAAIGTLPFLGPAYEDDPARSISTCRSRCHDATFDGILIIVGC